MTNHSPVAVYVPAPDSILAVDPRSGIVGTPFGEWWQHRHDVDLPADDPQRGHILIDYEGNRYGASNMITFADRVSHAHDRHVTCYPTIARATVAADQLVRAGTYHPDHWRVEVENAEQLVALSKWLELWTGDGFDSDTLHAELRCTDRAVTRR